MCPIIRTVFCHPPLISPVEEDSTLRKILTCVPLIGDFFVLYYSSRSSLNSKINACLGNKVEDVNRLIALIAIETQYRFADAIRVLLVTAYMVAMSVTGMFGLMPFLGYFMVSLLSAVCGMFTIRALHGCMVVDELEAGGFRKDIRMW